MKLSVRKTCATATIIVAMCCMLASCSNNDFKLSGRIEGADEKTLVLERGFNGQWIALDSVKTKSNGDFAISFEAPTDPEVYRLRMDDRYVYFPIDSLEHLTFKASIEKFDTDYELAGSDNAVALMNFEKQLSTLNYEDTIAVNEFKRKVYNEIIRDGKANILCYHVLNKTIVGKYLFDPTDAFDIKIYAAVATAYKHYRPNDPRTSLLEMVAIEGRKKVNSENGRQNVIQAQEISAIDIDLKDVNGESRKLSDMLKQGKPTAVIFSLLTDEKSPAQNIEIAKIYKANKGRINIYHVCLDFDQLAWKNAATNLPWTVVYDPDGANSINVVRYNVVSMPAVYIYNAKGELVDQAVSFSDMSAKLSRL